MWIGKLFATCFLVALFWLAASPQGAGPKKFPLYAVEAEWGYQDGPAARIKPCDPPMPKDSNIACSEPDKMYTFRCPDSAIGLFPPDASSYLYTVDAATKTHLTVYCIIPGEQ